MAEVYTVTINNETPTEITGGRVGHFIVQTSGTLVLGPSTLGIGYGPTVITDGAIVNASSGAPVAFYVTSPDDVYAVIFNGSPTTEDLTIFHNR